jgi:hypothetical protein
MPPIRGGRYPTYYTTQQYELLDSVFIKPISNLITSYLPCRHCGDKCDITERSKLLHKIFFDFNSTDITCILDVVQKSTDDIMYQKPRMYLYLLTIDKSTLMLYTVSMKTRSIIRIQK